MGTIAVTDYASQARQIAAQVDRLIAYAANAEHLLEPAIAAAHPSYADSVRNLVHYLALRQTDLRQLQSELAEMGLSSLGRFESCVLATLESVSDTLHRLAGEGPVSGQPPAPVVIAEGTALLRKHSDALFGLPAGGRHGRIMVTMPGEAATNQALVADLVTAGMDIARVNTAHDDLPAWLQMIEHIAGTRRPRGRRVHIEADLSGPKIRTGTLVSGPRVQKFRPARGPRGEMLAPACVRLVPSTTCSPESELPVDPELLALAQPGDVLAIRDSRARWRRFTLTEDKRGELTVIIDRTVYAESGAALLLERSRRQVASGSIGDIPARETALRLHHGDAVMLTRDQSPGNSSDGLPHIPCVPPEALDHAESGQSAWFDDGRIGGAIESVGVEGVVVRITHAQPTGSNLRAQKGINLPDTRIDLPAMPDADIAALESLVHHVDMIGLSFVRQASDVELLQEHLERLHSPDTGIVLKIETRAGFSNLPRILLTAMRSPRVAVMVARGDLAVEIGFERLAEVQEEILWLCEAAHIPVIWATQVLEDMARTGAPSRAEVTDAAMAERADCFMLNKGPYIVAAVSMLSDVLRRMEAHQYKKRSMLRRLAVSEELLGPLQPPGQADDPLRLHLP